MGEFQFIFGNGVEFGVGGFVDVKFDGSFYGE